MDIASFLIGLQAGQNAAEKDTYNQALAEMMMLREPRDFTHDGSTNKKLSLRAFKYANGNTLAQLPPYSFAGFDTIEGFRFADAPMVMDYALRDCTALRIIDVTMSTELTFVGFLPHSLDGCTALEAIIARPGANGLTDVIFQKGFNSPNETFCVYVPRNYYDAVIANHSTDSPIPTSRFRILEDYPAIDNWFSTT